jgi:hypothetical protein
LETRQLRRVALRPEDEFAVSMVLSLLITPVIFFQLRQRGF